MEDVWALGGSCPRVEAQRAGSWRIGSGVEDQGGQALGGLVRALKIRGAGACLLILDIKECFTPHAPS